MNYTEFLEIFQKLEEYFNKHDDSQTMYYYKSFKYMKKDDFNKIVNLAIEQCEFFPKIYTLKEIREQIKKEEYKPISCNKCNGSGMVFYIKKFEGYPYSYAARCDCTNGERLSTLIPTAKQVGIDLVLEG